MTEKNGMNKIVALPVGFSQFGATVKIIFMQ